MSVKIPRQRDGLTGGSTADGSVPQVGSPIPIQLDVGRAGDDTH